MALAQQMNSFGSNHPGLNFLGGLAAGVALMTAATFGALTMQSQNNVEAASLTQTSISDDWSVPRVTVSGFGSPARSSDDDAMSAQRLIDVRSMSFATTATEEQTLTAPRVTVSGFFGSPSLVSDDPQLAAPRLIDVRTMSFATVATEEQTLTAPRVTVSSLGSPARSSDDDVMSAPRVTIDQPRHGGGSSDGELAAERVLVQ